MNEKTFTPENWNLLLRSLQAEKRDFDAMVDGIRILPRGRDIDALNEAADLFKDKGHRRLTVRIYQGKANGCDKMEFVNPAHQQPRPVATGPSDSQDPMQLAVQNAELRTEVRLLREENERLRIELAGTDEDDEGDEEGLNGADAAGTGTTEVVLGMIKDLAPVIMERMMAPPQQPANLGALPQSNLTPAAQELAVFIDEKFNGQEKGLLTDILAHLANGPRELMGQIYEALGNAAKRQSQQHGQ